MRKRIAGGVAALVMAAAGMAAAPVAAQVSVRFARPLGFTDARNGVGPNQPLRGTLTELTRILEHLGSTHLRPGERLDLTVRDIDLVGIGPLGYGVAGGPRIVTGATPPRIRLAYVLRRDGRVIVQGEDTVTDPHFLITQNPRFSSGPLYYERRILRDWFDTRFRYGLGRG